MPPDESLNQLINEALEKLDLALMEALKLSSEGGKQFYQVGKLGRSIGLIREFQAPIFEKYPEFKPVPPWQNEPDPCLTEEQKALIAKLSQEKLEDIDHALLSYANRQFQKVAKIIGLFMMESDLHLPGIPDIFYAQRIEALASKGLLEHQGNLKFMRYSEVRAPNT